MCRFVLIACLALLTSGCQVGYLLKSAMSQADLLSRRVPVEEALRDPRLTPAQKTKLQVAQEAREFAEKDLGLKHTKNYDTFVQLDAPYVTWVVSASVKDELKHFLWKYPLVGRRTFSSACDLRQKSSKS